MKKLTLLLSVLILSLGYLTGLNAQEKRHKMTLHFKPMAEGYKPVKQGYFVDKLDSITFSNKVFDMGFKMTFKHKERDKGEINIVPQKDIQSWKMKIVEEWKVKNAPDDILIMRLKGDTQEQERSGVLNGTLQGLTRKMTYMIYAYGIDAEGTTGPLTRLSFSIPDFPLVGSPKIDVKFSEITHSSFKVTFKPNKDVKGYYYLGGDKASMSEAYKQTPFGAFPNLDEYVKAFGADFKTRQPHTGETSMTYNDLVPNTLHGIYIILLDQAGQPSELQVFDVTTLKKGTSQPSRIKITVLDVAHDRIKAQAEPDENTSVFRFMLVEKAKYDEDSAGLIKFLKEQPNSSNFPISTKTDIAEWHDLPANTEYYLVAVGQNGDDKWGEPTVVAVRTKPAPAGSSANPKANVIPLRASAKVGQLELNVH
ncbi:MAG: hypothetical protein Q4A64_05430 [Porphyromonadaceae bacterium]|nr:hypothetical protein [Porphyromonadaceae bacterium]